MNELFDPPFRSRKVLAHAKGQPCTLRFPGKGICDGGGATTVPCHIRDRHKGMALKSSDHSVAFGCAGCHRFLDEGYVQAGWTADDLAPYERRALQETWEILIRDGIIGFPHDKPRQPKRPKPLSDREKPPKRPSRFPKGRKLQSANNLRRKR